MLVLYLGQFRGGCVQGSSIFLWLWIPLAFGVLVVVVVGLAEVPRISSISRRVYLSEPQEYQLWGAPWQAER